MKRKPIEFLDRKAEHQAYWKNVLQRLPLEHDKPDITPRETEALYALEAIAYRQLAKYNVVTP